MFGIDSCRVQMQSRFYLQISTNILWSNPKSLFVIKFNYDIRVLACLPLSLTFAAPKTSQTNLVFHFLELLGLWTVALKTLSLYVVTAEVTEIIESNRKISNQPESNHETRITKGKKVKENDRFKHYLKMTFLLNFIRLSQEVETLKKNGGAGRHTQQLQGKI